MTLISQPHQRNQRKDPKNKQVSSRQKSRQKSQKNPNKSDYPSHHPLAKVPNSTGNSTEKRIDKTLHNPSSGQLIDPKDLAMFVTTNFEGHKLIASKLRLSGLSEEASSDAGGSSEDKNSHKIKEESGFKLDKNYLRRIPRLDPDYPAGATPDSSENDYQKRLSMSSRAAQNYHSFKVFQQHLCSGEFKILMSHIAPGERFQFLSHIPYYDDDGVNIGQIGCLAFNHRSVYALKWVELLRTSHSQNWIACIHHGITESFPFLSNKKIFGMIGFINQDMFDVTDGLQPLEYGLSQQLIMLEASPDGKMIDRFMWKGSPIQPIVDGTDDGTDNSEPSSYEDS